MTNRMQARFLNLTLLLASLALPAMAQPKVTVIDAPGAGTVSSPICAPLCGTTAYAINDLGVIVGSYTDAKIVPHGFLRQPDGRFVSFDAPGAGLGAGLNEGTVAYSINDLGAIAGQFEDSNLVFHGFVRDCYGFFTTFEAKEAGKGANQGTFAFSINLEGAIAGTYVDSNNTNHGFERSPEGEIVSFDPPGSVYTYPCQETCINSAGIVTGFYQDVNNAVRGFIRYSDGKIFTFDAPGVGTGANKVTIAASINPQGAISGYFLDSNGMAHGFIRYDEGTYNYVQRSGGCQIRRRHGCA